MAILSRPSISGSHWYRPDTGEACHEVPRADGHGVRSTNVSDARKLGLLPSVTNILGVIDKGGLVKWKIEKAVKSAFDNPKRDDESMEYWVERVIGSSQDEVWAASTHGTNIHAAIETVLRGGTCPDDASVYVSPVMALLEKEGFTMLECEKRVVNRAQGFAGTMDYAGRHNERPCVIDFKNNKSKPGKKMVVQETYGMQLVAYASTHWTKAEVNDVDLFNVLISSTEPGRVELYHHTKGTSNHDMLTAFYSACSLWRFLKKYDPRTQP